MADRFNSIPPYGVAIQDAIVSGDLGKMKSVQKDVEKWLQEHGDVSQAIEILKLEIAKLESKG